MLSLPTLLYLADICGDLDWLFFITGILAIAVIICSAIGWIISSDNNSKEGEATARRVMARAFPFALTLFVLSGLTPSKDTIYGIIVAERAAGAPSSPALDQWMREKVGGLSQENKK